VRSHFETGTASYGDAYRNIYRHGDGISAVFYGPITRR
jgi:hypothetical protein